MTASELVLLRFDISCKLEMHAMTNIAVDLMPTPSRERSNEETA